MGLIWLSDARHHQLQRFRRNTWKAIALCIVLRLAGTALGFDLVEPARSQPAAPTPLYTLEQDFRL
ncbi:hypothetical protein H7F50_10885 [Novosphingobium flavum]|uniref:hypothetical protein n=1 Tax=Novosphingobium aerophilum TaxID=2839843 RepID=UPI001639FF2F|nr:hypothetical protein [Novosphingobium aerophilum]MBC2662263.1 hypothetical protein [Novosphingobium aerophilum]